MRKFLSVVALMLACMLVFAACGNVAKSTEAAETESTQNAEATDTAAAPADGEAKTIVYWTMWESTEKQGQVIQQAVDAYMKDTGNVVDVQFKGRTGIREGLQPALDGGMSIDLFDEDVDRVNGVWGDYIMDLEEFAAASDYEATALSSLIRRRCSSRWSKDSGSMRTTRISRWKSQKSCRLRRRNRPAPRSRRSISL